MIPANAHFTVQMEKSIIDSLNVRVTRPLVAGVAKYTEVSSGWLSYCVEYKELFLSKVTYSSCTFTQMGISTEALKVKYHCSWVLHQGLS